jgi:hypothetical protein
MSSNSVKNNTPNVTINASEEKKYAAPRWLSEVLLILTLWIKSGLQRTFVGCCAKRGYKGGAALQAQCLDTPTQ